MAPRLTLRIIKGSRYSTVGMTPYQCKGNDHWDSDSVIPNQSRYGSEKLFLGITKSKNNKTNT